MCGTMNIMNTAKRIFILFLIIITTIFLFFIVRTPKLKKSIPMPRWAPNTCPFGISEQTITPLSNTKHFLVSAYMDQRIEGFDIRIIGIFKKDSIQPLHCLFCCAGQLSRTTPATIRQHPQYFGFPFIPTDVMCQIPQNCNATHVSLLTEPETKVFHKTSQKLLPIRNQKTMENKEKKLQFDFTVCISTLYGDYNNVLQFAQTLEIYRLLGVDRVVVYNTSCGPDLDRLLQSYSQEGFVEMVPWPIDKHLNPSHGWLFSAHPADIHYYGQLVALNECIYRSMDRSRYVLTNDIDEIIMPYQHDNLGSLMNMLQQQHPNTGVFSIENHVFHSKPSGESKWRGVPGFNIMEHVYSEEVNRNEYPRNKMIIKPRSVEQTSVHEVLSVFGETFKVPPDICRMIHSRKNTAKQSLDKLHMDTRLWDFKEKLLPRVDKVLRRAGLLS